MAATQRTPIPVIPVPEIVIASTFSWLPTEVLFFSLETLATGYASAPLVSSVLTLFSPSGITVTADIEGSGDVCELSGFDEATVGSSPWLACSRACAKA